MSTVDLSGNLWNFTATAPVNTALLEEDISVDLVVVGGGFTGLSAALHAAQTGADVCVVEAEDVGFGGSGRNVGLVNAGLWLPPQAVIDVLGPDAGACLNSALAEGPSTVFNLIEKHQIQCEANRKGTLHCAHDAVGVRDLERRQVQLLAIGAPVKLLGAEEARQRVGSPAVHSALYDPRAGTIQPKAYAQGLAHASIAAGARIVQNTRVEKIAHNGACWTVHANGHCIKARALIEATNAYGQTRNRFTPMYFFQMATRPLPNQLLSTILPAGEGCWDTALVMSSFRRDAAGRIILGSIGRIDHFASGIHMAWARRKISALFPQLSGVEFEHFWHGQIATTTDHLPKIHRIGPNGYSAFGYSGRGIGTGTIFGRELAQAALTEDEHSLPVAPVDHYREKCNGLRAVYYESGALLAHASKNRLVKW